MTGQLPFALLVLAVALERVAELVVSRRNLAWSRSRGGVEAGDDHYPVMVALHVALLLGCLLEVRLRHPAPHLALAVAMTTLVVASQALRWWCIATLGRRWSTRVVVIPGLARITSGPYRWLRHPNYVAVVVEGFALPMVGLAWTTAAAFTVLNALVLRVRIRVEDRALAALEPAA